MKSILVADDQLCVRAFLRAQLILEGYIVTDVGDRQSVEAYLSCSRPDLVILDLVLAGEGGFDLLPDIKRRYPRVPIIILTAYDGFRNDPRLSLADRYLVKDFDFEGLRKTISELVSRPQADESAREAWRASAI